MTKDVHAPRLPKLRFLMELNFSIGLQELWTLLEVPRVIATEKFWLLLKLGFTSLIMLINTGNVIQIKINV